MDAHRDGADPLHSAQLSPQYEASTQFAMDYLGTLTGGAGRPRAGRRHSRPAPRDSSTQHRCHDPRASRFSGDAKLGLQAPKSLWPWANRECGPIRCRSGGSGSHLRGPDGAAVGQGPVGRSVASIGCSTAAITAHGEKRCSEPFVPSSSQPSTGRASLKAPPLTTRQLIIQDLNNPF